MTQELLESISVFIVSLLHIIFCYIEMFLWDKPSGRKIFGLSQDYAKKSATLAANQGLYNGFLAAGLIWSFVDESFTDEIRLFFLSCIVIAGLFAAFTVNRRIFWIQAFPAVIALTLVLLS